MSQTQQIIVAVLAHNLGSIILVGSLLFMQIAYLPGVSDVRTATARMHLRLDGIALCLRWVWLGVLIIYGSGLWAALALLDLSQWPVHVVWMTALSVLLLILLVIAQLGPQRAARLAMQGKRVRDARRLYGRLRALLLAALVVAAGAMLLGVSGAVLVS